MRTKGIIRIYELKKFSLSAVLMLLILLNQNIIRVLKDSFIVTLVGPDVISFIKLWFEMPIGILFVLIYNKLCNTMTTEKAFSMIVVFFLIFFIIFGFILYPFQSYIHPDYALVSKHIELIPMLKRFVILWGKWSFVLFYVMGELWSVVVFTLLFWQLANKISKTDEAKRFYPLLSLIGQLSLLMSGKLICYLVQNECIFNSIYRTSKELNEITLKSLTTIIAIIGFTILFLQHTIAKNFVYAKDLPDQISYKPSLLKMNLIESFKVISKSNYLWLISALTVSYHIATNLIEGVWMSEVKELYPTSRGFMHYQGEVLFWTGISTIFCTFIGNIVIRRYGWFFSAIITPVVTMVAGILFFFIVINKNKLVTFPSIFYQVSPSLTTVFVGGMQNVLCKGTKYSLFDFTREMLYIPLNEEIKTKGKAAVDIIGTKVGKSFGSIIQFILFTSIPGARYSDIAGILAILFIFVTSAWILTVNKVASQYALILKKEEV